MWVTFFRHENHPFPPAISNNGKLRLGKKSDLLNNLQQNEETEPPDVFDAKAVDGATVVHLLSTRTATTFNEYAHDVFEPHIMMHLDNL